MRDELPGIQDPRSYVQGHKSTGRPPHWPATISDGRRCRTCGSSYSPRSSNHMNREDSLASRVTLPRVRCFCFLTELLFVHSFCIEQLALSIGSIKTVVERHRKKEENKSKGKITR